MKHVRNTSARCEVAVVLGENSANLRSRAISVIGRSFNNNRHSTGRITLVNNLVELLAIPALARTPFDRALNVVAGHALRPCSLDRAAQTRIAARVATARFCGDGDFL